VRTQGKARSSELKKGDAESYADLGAYRALAAFSEDLLSRCCGVSRLCRYIANDRIAAAVAAPDRQLSADRARAKAHP
jgi:hypothetical protein